MENTAGRLNLGVILCKHCMKVIDTLDTERVQTYYSDCQDLFCLQQRMPTQQVKQAEPLSIHAAYKQQF